MKCACGGEVKGGFLVIGNDTVNGKFLNVMLANGYKTEEMNKATPLCGKACLMEWLSGQVDEMMGIKTTQHMGEDDRS